jgi:NAD+ synthase
MKHRDPQKERNLIVDFIKKVFQSAGLSKAIIGLSGGVDSSVVCALAVQALGKDAIVPMLLPYGNLNTEGVLSAMKVIEENQIALSHVIRIDIKPAVDTLIAYDRTINTVSSEIDRVRKGNIMARVRMTYLFDQAKKQKGLVVGTENKSEHTLGYFTRFGDAASDIEPILHLFKTEVFELARYLKVPQSIIEQTPTAGLWPGQTDEGELGFTYREADEICFLLYDEKKTIDEVVSLGFATELVERIQARVSRNSFKHTTPHSLL